MTFRMLRMKAGERGRARIGHHPPSLALLGVEVDRLPSVNCYQQGMLHRECPHFLRPRSVARFRSGPDTATAGDMARSRNIRSLPDRQREACSFRDRNGECVIKATQKSSDLR